MSMGLVVWSVACIGVGLGVMKPEGVSTGLGVCCIVWALGMALWMLAGWWF